MATFSSNPVRSLSERKKLLVFQGFCDIELDLSFEEVRYQSLCEMPPKSGGGQYGARRSPPAHIAPPIPGTLNKTHGPSYRTAEVPRA